MVVYDVVLRMAADGRLPLLLRVVAGLLLAIVASGYRKPIASTPQTLQYPLQVCC